MALLVVPPHAGEHVVAEAPAGQRGGELVGVTLDVGHRAPGEHGVRGKRLEAIAIPAEDDGEVDEARSSQACRDTNPAADARS